MVENDWRRPYETCPQNVKVVVLVLDGQLNAQIYPVVRRGDSFYFVDSEMGDVEVYPDGWREFKNA